MQTLWHKKTFINPKSKIDPKQDVHIRHTGTSIPLEAWIREADFEVGNSRLGCSSSSLGRRISGGTRSYTCQVRYTCPHTHTCWCTTMGRTDRSLCTVPDKMWPLELELLATAEERKVIYVYFCFLLFHVCLNWH